MMMTNKEDTRTTTTTNVVVVGGGGRRISDIIREEASSQSTTAATRRKTITRRSMKKQAASWSSSSSSSWIFYCMATYCCFFLFLLLLVDFKSPSSSSSSSSVYYFVNGEIIELDLLIDASSEEVHYIEGYLQAPGKIDLSALTFTSTLRLPDFMNGGGEGEGEEGYDDLFEFEGEDDAIGFDDDLVGEEGWDGDDGLNGDGDGDGDGSNDDEFQDNYPDLPPPPVVPPGSTQETRPPETGDVVEGEGGTSSSSSSGSEATATAEPTSPSEESSSSSSSSMTTSEPAAPPEEATTSPPVEEEGSSQVEGEGGEGDDPEEGNGEGEEGESPSSSSTTTTTTTIPATTTNSTTPPAGGGDRDRRLKVTTMKISSNSNKKKKKNTQQKVTNFASSHAYPNDDARVSVRTLNEEEGGSSGGSSSTIQSVVDIVLFMVTDDCRTDPWGGGCDWSTLGVGVPDEEMEGGVSYCCSQDTADRGLCTQDKIGTLLVDHTLLGKAHGDHRHIDVPAESGVDFTMSEDDAVFEVTYSGNYIMVMANCYDYGMDVIASGDMVWQSVGGYLPGDMYGLMLFYGALACIYIVIAFWYYCGMRMFQDAAIPIQRFILATIILGLLEVSFRGLDLFYWNYDGKRSDGLMYVALTLGVLKRGISRCLAVMVAMGWGVVRDSLGRAYCQIVLLGLVYSGLTLARDYLVLAAVEVEHINLTEEEELLDLALILTPLVIFVNVVFYFWIITSLNSTTEYLRNMNQASKLARHLRLRCLILSSLVVVGIWLMFSIVQVFTNTLSQDQVWILEAVMHVNYLYILVGVAILWRPNSHAKDYAMQMELSPDGDEDNELELSSNIPSAISDEDMDSYDDTYGNDPDHPNGVRVRNGVST